MNPTSGGPGRDILTIARIIILLLSSFVRLDFMMVQIVCTLLSGLVYSSQKNTFPFVGLAYIL